MQLAPKSKKFILRRIRKSDCKSWCENIIEKDKSVNYMGAPSNLRDAKKRFLTRFKNKKKGADRFVIDIGGNAVGEVNVHIIAKNHKAYFSYWIGKDYRGNGFVTDAVKLLMPYAFSKHGLRRIEALIRINNKSSARVLEKAGFRLEGILRKNRLKDGKYLDDMMFAKVR